MTRRSGVPRAVTPDHANSDRASVPWRPHGVGQKSLKMRAMAGLPQKMNRHIMPAPKGGNVFMLVQPLGIGGGT